MTRLHISFTVLEFRRHLEAAALPLVGLMFVVMVAVVIAVAVAVQADGTTSNV